MESQTQTFLELDYPYVKYYVTEKDVQSSFLQIKDYKLSIVPINDYVIYNIPNIPSELSKFNGKKQIIVVDPDDYWKMGFLSDYFNQHVRVKARRYDEKYSPFEYWTLYKKDIIEHLQRKQTFPLTIKMIDEALYEKVVGCNTFKPQLLSGMIKLFKSKSVLDISAGWGDRLIGAIASEVNYLGVDPNDDLFEGYKHIMKAFVKNGNFLKGQSENSLEVSYKNDKNTYKVICSPFQTANLGTYECDLIFTCPPYFDLEIYSDKETQSVKQFSELSAWEEGFLYVSLKKAWDKLIDQGHMAIVINNIRGKQDFVLKMVKWINDNLKDCRYLGLLPFSNSYKGKSPQPIWIWKKVESLKV
jgi:hypothetical protein